MREVNVSIITDNIKEMCIEANHFLTDDMKNVFENAVKNEESALGKQVLGQLEENLKIAGEDMIPICQDTGMAVVFINVGQDVHLTGGDITDAINEGVRRGYVDGYLRKSVVKDPIYRENTKDNTPAVIHFNIVPGDKIDITVAPKGFGSENMSRVFMLKPADGIEGVKEAILTAVKDAGPNACPPMVVGVGIGGTFDRPWWTWRNTDSTCNQYRDISYTYCRTSGCSKHLLPCKQTFTQSNIIREANHG